MIKDNVFQYGLPVVFCLWVLDFAQKKKAGDNYSTELGKLLGGLVQGDPDQS
jgi:hypothetical protein